MEPKPDQHESHTLRDHPTTIQRIKYNERERVIPQNHRSIIGEMMTMAIRRTNKHRGGARHGSSEAGETTYLFTEKEIV